jgi:ABC-type lipoprotein release transport system permease subunit
MAMRDQYEWLIGTRYLRSGQRRGFLSFISAISMVGLMLGVAVLVVVMSVMNGFESELRARILGVTAHATLESLDENMLSDWRRVQEQCPTSKIARCWPRASAWRVSRCAASIRRRRKSQPVWRIRWCRVR